MFSHFSTSTERFGSVTLSTVLSLITYFLEGEGNHMSKREIRVALVGAGMAGRAHAYGYRNIESMFYPFPATVRLVAVADAYEPLARQTAERFGFERVEPSWQAIAQAKDIDAVSVALPNYEHRSIVEALIAAGKHVLCEKPLAPTAQDSWALLSAARRAGIIHAVGFNLRRSAAIAAVAQQAQAGALGELRYFSGNYYADYALDPQGPYSWRYNRAQAGGGALVDLGAHIIDLSRFIMGDIATIAGGVTTTAIKTRPVPAGITVGHEKAQVTNKRREVDTDDFATASVEFANGAAGQISVSRMGTGFRNAVRFTVIGSEASAEFDFERAAEFAYFDSRNDNAFNGFRRVVTGPEHPYFKQVIAMPVSGVGTGLNETFIGQAYEGVMALVEERPVKGATFEDGYANALICEAIARSAETGARVSVEDVASQVENSVTTPRGR
jgi:predicted dehydrogenase